jgi:cell division transport system permease protein
MRRLEYFFNETAAGLRRNGTAAFAAMSTAFIALFLFGLALLIARQFDLVIDAWTGNVQVAVYLSDPVKPDNVARLQADLEGLPAVSIVEFEDKDAACARFNKLFANQPVFLENIECEEVIPASLRVNLADASQFEQVTALMGCVPDPERDNQIVCTQPGVRNVADYRELLDRLVAITSVLSIGVLFIAGIMLISAIVLVANTLKMGMYARRKEIGIMRLVGATNWRIRVPFLVEGLVEALLGALAAVVALFLIKVFLIDRLRDQVAFVPLIKNADVLSVAPWIIIAAVFVAVIAGTIGMRRFLDV